VFEPRILRQGLTLPCIYRRMVVLLQSTMECDVPADLRSHCWANRTASSFPDAAAVGAGHMASHPPDTRPYGLLPDVSESSGTPGADAVRGSPIHYLPVSRIGKKNFKNLSPWPEPDKGFF
jgi:hypothetical protein